MSMATHSWGQLSRRFRYNILPPDNPNFLRPDMTSYCRGPSISDVMYHEVWGPVSVTSCITRCGAQYQWRHVSVTSCNNEVWAGHILEIINELLKYWEIAILLLNKHNAELQWTDPGTKDKAKLSARACIFPREAQNGHSSFPSV